MVGRWNILLGCLFAGAMLVLGSVNGMILQVCATIPLKNRNEVPLTFLRQWKIGIFTARRIGEYRAANFNSCLGGGNSNILSFHPEDLGKTPILTSILFKWVGLTTNQNVHSLKLTATAPENRPLISKETRKNSNHPYFSGANMFEFREG